MRGHMTVWAGPFGSPPAQRFAFQKRTAEQPGQAVTGDPGGRAERTVGFEATGEREVSAHSRATVAESQDLPRPDVDGPPFARRGAIEGSGAVRSRQRHDRPDGERDGEPSQRHLQRGGPRVVVEQPVGPQECALIHRPAGCESGASPTPPSEILHRAVRSGAIHHPVRPTGPVGRGQPHSAS